MKSDEATKEEELADYLRSEGFAVRHQLEFHSETYK